MDRLPRRPILIMGDFGRAALLLTIPVAYVADVLTLGQLYVVGFLVGICTVFFDVAYQSYLPSLVERDQIVEGNSKLEVSRSAAQIGGPGIGGVLIELITAPYAILVDAVSFLASGLFVLRIRKLEERVVSTGPEQRSSLWVELKEGLRFVLGNPNLRAQAGCTATSNLFFSLGFSIMLVYFVRVLDLSPGVIGLVFSIGAAGSLVGAFTSRRISTRFGIGPTTIAVTLLQGPAVLLIPLAPVDSPIPFLIASQLAVGFVIVVYNITQLSYRQAICPARLQGRMNSVMRFLVWGNDSRRHARRRRARNMGRSEGDHHRLRYRRRRLVPLDLALAAAPPARDARADRGRAPFHGARRGASRYGRSALPRRRLLTCRRGREAASGGIPTS
ncbi:MAG: MFS transporter [Actinobacteria bacterium]|nr:MFS transporter [Actinomycetota bacterium]